MARLKGNVLLRNPETGAVELLADGSDLPDWARGLVGDHALDGDELPDLDELDPDDPAREGGGGQDEPPPKSGTGSGKAAWSAYARSHGVEVPEGADRDDIIAALDAAEVRTQ